MITTNELRHSSFRGEAFILLDISVAGGKKGGVKEIPFSDRDSIQNLGNKNQVFSLNILICGEDYIQKREAFINALEEKAPGELLLSSHEGFSALPLSWSYTEKPDLEMGEVRFSVSFVPDNENTFPGISEGSSEDIYQRINDAGHVFSDIYADKTDFSGTLLKQAGIDSCLTSLLSFQEELKGFLSPENLPGYNELEHILTKTLPELLLNNPAAIASNLMALMRMPGNLKKKVKDLFSAGNSSDNTERESYRDISVNQLFSPYRNIISKTLTQETDQGMTYEESIRLKNNLMAHKDLICTGAVLALANASLALEQNNRQELMRVIQELNAVGDEVESILDELSKESENMAQDANAHSLTHSARDIFYTGYTPAELRKQVVSMTCRTLLERSCDLKSEKSFITERDTTPIELAWELLGDPGRDGEIIQWNNPADPVCIKKGSVIKYYV